MVDAAKNRVRIGIDVGGTNTDAAILRGDAILATIKTATTEDVTSGVVAALTAVLNVSAVKLADVGAIMIGTTHFVNALVQRKELERVAIIRLCGPATASVPPFADWPDDLAAAVRGPVFLLPGGMEYDGQHIEPFDQTALRNACEKIRQADIKSIAVVGVFSLVNPEQEIEAQKLIAEELPEATVTLSHELGRLGLLERENATILNACLARIGSKSIAAFRQSLMALGLECPLYLSQNDGTLMTAEAAERFPVLTFASGPTNSMRGAAFLSGLTDALVIDIGGTTSDIGALVNGFPRQAGVDVEVAGARTNFRMPDVLSIGLGGGSHVVDGPNGVKIGPVSVGFRLQQQSMVFGGSVLTATDVAAAAGMAKIGNHEAVAHLDCDLVKRATAEIKRMLEDIIDRVKLSRDDVSVILVGGGSILVEGKLAGASVVIRPQHFGAANAVGAAIAQVSGEVDRVVSLEKQNREEVLSATKQDAIDIAVSSGAKRSTVKIADVDETPLAYLPGGITRVRVKAVGDLNL